MQYDVHIYATVRIKVSGIEAESQDEAMQKAEKDVNTRELFPHRLVSDSLETEDAEEITGFLVDEVGDEQHENSCQYDAERAPI